MSITIVQSKAFNASWSGSFSANVTAGNTVYLFAFQYNAAGMSSNSPLFGGAAVSGASKLLDGQSTAGGDVYGAIWQLPNLGGGAASVALTNVNGTIDANVGMVAMEASGLGTAPILDAGAAPNPQTANAGTGTVASGSTGNITTAPELILTAAIAFGSNPGTPGAPWTSLQASSFSTASWQVVTSSGASYAFSGSAVTVGWFAGVAAVEVASGAAVSGTVQPRATVPVPRHRPGRGIWGGIQGQAFVKVPAPVQQFRLAPRRKLARAYVQFIPVTTMNAAAVAGVAGTIPALMINQTRVAVRRDGRIVRQ